MDTRTRKFLGELRDYLDYVRETQHPLIDQDTQKSLEGIERGIVEFRDTDQVSPGARAAEAASGGVLDEARFDTTDDLSPGERAAQEVA